MPVKRRTAKRRLDPAAELEAWSTTFGSGYDFFGDLEPFGIESTGAAREAAGDAWERLGDRFLETWTETREPWALVEFGRPSCQ